MLCKNCGSKLREGSPFCLVCGADVSEMEGVDNSQQNYGNVSSDENKNNKNNSNKISREEIENKEEKSYEEQQNVTAVTHNRTESRDEYIEEFIICPKCGKRVIKGSRFCNGCGKTL